MPETDYFKKALSDFAYENASGGAIRHLVDLGYTVKQISEQLAFPTPYGRVQETAWKHMLESKMILTEEPGSGRISFERAEYIKEYDKYGRTSFRKVNLQEPGPKQILWKERYFHGSSLAAFLHDYCARNGEGNSYASCDFGLWEGGEPAKDERLKFLNDRQQEYVLGLPWEKRIVYHRLNSRMKEIICRLYENDAYHGKCYFIKTEEKIRI